MDLRIGVGTLDEVLACANSCQTRGVSTGVGTVSTGVGMDMSGYIRTCPSGFKRCLDIRISSQLDIRISRYPDMSGYPGGMDTVQTWTQYRHY